MAAIVSGGTQGIGAAVAAALARAGVSVAVIGRDGATAEAAARALPGGSGKPHLGIRCDVGDPLAVRTAVNLAARELGPIGTLVNCAGVVQNGLLVRLRDSEAEAVLRTNTLGPLYLCREVSRHMLRQRAGGSIVSIGSVVGSHGNEGQAGVRSTSLRGLPSSTLRGGCESDR